MYYVIVYLKLNIGNYTKSDKYPIRAVTLHYSLPLFIILIIVTDILTSIAKYLNM